MATVAYERLPGAVATGPLTTGPTGDSYATGSATWYDGIGRDVEDVNYGHEQTTDTNHYLFDGSGELRLAYDIVASGIPTVAEETPPATNSPSNLSKTSDYSVSQTIYYAPTSGGTIVDSVRQRRQRHPDDNRSSGRHGRDDRELYRQRRPGPRPPGRKRHDGVQLRRVRPAGYAVGGQPSDLQHCGRVRRGSRRFHQQPGLSPSTASRTWECDFWTRPTTATTSSSFSTLPWDAGSTTTAAAWPPSRPNPPTCWLLRLF